MTKNDSFTPITLEVHHETAKAYLVTGPGGSKDDADWLPKSQLRNVERNGNLLNADAADWILEAKGLDGLVE